MSDKEITMVASNSKECIRSLTGHRIVGVMFDALPVGRRDLQAGNKTLVFEDGSGFTFSASGGFWRELPSDIQRAIGEHEKELRAKTEDIRGVLELAGVLSDVDS